MATRDQMAARAHLAPWADSKTLRDLLLACRAPWDPAQRPAAPKRQTASALPGFLVPMGRRAEHAQRVPTRMRLALQRV